MKYTAKINQATLVGKIKIEPKGGDLSDADVKAVREHPWGKELIEKGMLIFAGASAPAAAPASAPAGNAGSNDKNTGA